MMPYTMKVFEDYFAKFYSQSFEDRYGISAIKLAMIVTRDYFAYSLWNVKVWMTIETWLTCRILSISVSITFPSTKVSQSEFVWQHYPLFRKILRRKKVPFWSCLRKYQLCPIMTCVRHNRSTITTTLCHWYRFKFHEHILVVLEIMSSHTQQPD